MTSAREHTHIHTVHVRSRDDVILCQPALAARRPTLTRFTSEVRILIIKYATNAPHTIKPLWLYPSGAQETVCCACQHPSDVWPSMYKYMHCPNTKSWRGHIGWALKITKEISRFRLPDTTQSIGHTGTIIEEQAVKCMKRLIQASCVALRISLVMSLSPFQSLPAIKGPMA